MRVTNSIVFGLVSLTCTVSAAKAPGKPVLAKRQALVTATKDGCTAVCVDLSDMGLGQGTDCDVYCTGGFSTTLPAKSTSTSTKIVTTTTKAALHQRTMTLGGGDCIATCWDLMPGTECDVQCKGDFEAEKPEPNKAARVANLEARENVQAHQAREARLDRKFGGIVARDDGTTVTVTSIPDYCTAGPVVSISTTVAGIPTILPAKIPQAAVGAGISEVLSQASVAISIVEQALPSAASSALSEASALLSSASAIPPVSANATIAISVVTSSAPSVSATITAKTTATSTSSKTTTESITSSETSTESTTSSETITASTSTTGIAVVPSATATNTPFQIGSSASVNHVSTGLVLFLLIDLVANAVFLI